MVASILPVERPFTSPPVPPLLPCPSTSESVLVMEQRNSPTSPTTPLMSSLEPSSSGSVGSDSTVVALYLRISVPPRPASSPTLLPLSVESPGCSGITAWNANGLLSGFVLARSLGWSPSPQLLVLLALVSVCEGSGGVALIGKLVFPHSRRGPLWFHGWHSLQLCDSAQVCAWIR